MSRPALISNLCMCPLKIGLIKNELMPACSATFCFDRSWYAVTRQMKGSSGAKPFCYNMARI